MQLLSILLGCIFFFTNGISGHEIRFPMEDCAGIFAGDFQPCIEALKTSILEWHQWTGNTPDNDCGFPCMSNLKGRFSKWEWKWDGKFRCDAIAPDIVGVSTKSSRKGAIEWAIKDFLHKATAKGHIKREEFKCV